MNISFRLRPFLFLLLFLPQYLIAQPVTLQDDTREALTLLDRLIEQKADLHKQRDAQTARLKEQCQQAKGYHRIGLLKEVFNLYSHYQTDSAQVALDLIKNAPEYATDETLKAYVHIGQAEIYGVAALYGEAEAEMRQVQDVLSQLRQNKELLLYYYRTQRTLYGWMADYTKMNSLHRLLQEKAMHYRDSLLQEDMGNKQDRDIVEADKLATMGKPAEALRVLSPYLKRTDKNNPNPYICFTAAQAYINKGDKERALYYLALTAIADMKMATNEYQALPLLAQKLYDNGDVERAYVYLLCSMEDASYCKAQLRAIETSHIFPIISKQYKQNERQQRHNMHAFIALLVVLLVGVSCTALFLRKQIRKLRALRREQKRTNSQLAAANGKIQEANARIQSALEKVQATNEELQQTYARLRMTDKIKEEYIARYLDRCRGYLDTLAEYRRYTLRMLKEHRIEELEKAAKSEQSIKQEQEKFYADFDAAFLTLYPQFIEKFNALLNPEAQLHCKCEGQLNTELRIFALIRLGVTDTTRIAHFLNYSVATVYNYRSKMRNKALCPPADFERMVVDLE